MNDYQVQVEIKCVNCDDFFTTYQTIHDGSIQEYHSIRMKRDRRLNILLNE
jgi:hypothetical protein